MMCVTMESLCNVIAPPQGGGGHRWRRASVAAGVGTGVGTARSVAEKSIEDRVRRAAYDFACGLAAQATRPNGHLAARRRRDRTRRAEALARVVVLRLAPLLDHSIHLAPALRVAKSFGRLADEPRRERDDGDGGQQEGRVRMQDSPWPTPETASPTPPKRRAQLPTRGRPAPYTAFRRIGASRIRNLLSPLGSFSSYQGSRRTTGPIWRLSLCRSVSTLAVFPTPETASPRMGALLVRGRMTRMTEA